MVCSIAPAVAAAPARHAHSERPAYREVPNPTASVGPLGHQDASLIGQAPGLNLAVPGHRQEQVVGG